jgi:hypothetical protein
MFIGGLETDLYLTLRDAIFITLEPKALMRSFISHALLSLTEITSSPPEFGPTTQNGF